jgi:hypothetical protein
MDAAAVPDPDALLDCVRAGFDEVLTLGGAHEPARLPLREPRAGVEPVVAGTAWSG